MTAIPGQRLTDIEEHAAATASSDTMNLRELQLSATPNEYRSTDTSMTQAVECWSLSFAKSLHVDAAQDCVQFAAQRRADLAAG